MFLYPHINTQQTYSLDLKTALFTDTDKDFGIQCLVSGRPEDDEDIREHVEDVHGEAEGDKEVLLRQDDVIVYTLHLDFDLCVTHNTDGEQEGTEGRVHEDHGLARKKAADNAKARDDYDSNKEFPSKGGEIYVGQDCKHGDRNSHHNRDQSAVDDVFPATQGYVTAHLDTIGHCEYPETSPLTLLQEPTF
ncbi:hypothetical protein J6590_001435 [Homalodisca vitripennis]|nr:hypothetical protein J6590_001435 [Homalodisca vitripennis]